MSIIESRLDFVIEGDSVLCARIGSYEYRWFDNEWNPADKGTGPTTRKQGNLYRYIFTVGELFLLRVSSFIISYYSCIGTFCLVLL